MGSHQQTKMNEGGNKQVRVDNWGIFFLQRLQMFFNKTDYCDLTLQFEGNVQLKVHRLVINACTDYFQILEQTCEMIEDILIMPSDLQADVVLPIVNFMYTGMLEFQMSIFDKLYKTASLMNITVLTKLLDAQKTPISPLPKPLNRKSSQVPHTWNLQGKKISARTSDQDLPATLPGRKLPVWKRKSAPITVSHTILPHFYPEQKRPTQIDPLAIFDNSPKPTRFEWPEEELPSLNLFESSFDDISYTSKPLLTQEDEPRPSTSFDRVKEIPDTHRRSTSHNHSVIDMEDVKDYVKEQRIRANMTEDDDEDDDDALDNDFNNHDESMKLVSNDSLKRKQRFETISAKRVRFSINEKENQIKHTRINITPTGKTSSDVDHTKIISEVLKKYPNLVKKNKNIRLKILAKSNTSPTSNETVKKTLLKKCSSRFSSLLPVSSTKTSKLSLEKNDEDGPWTCQRCSTPNEAVEFVLYYLYRKHMTDVHNEKFDSRMCKFCGHKSTKHNMLMYHQYTKHGVKPPPAYNFPKCNHCPYIALTEALLIRHKMNHTKYELQCIECKVTFSNQAALTSHVQITGHTGKSGKPNYDCQYCTKKFAANATLFSHIRMQHRDEARRDGIVSIDENQEAEELEEHEESDEFLPSEAATEKEDKVKIISDVKLPSMEQTPGSESLQQESTTLEPSSEAEALSNVASGIATSLGLVDVVVLDENQQFILHTDNQQEITTADSEFILPDLQDSQTFTTTQQVITSEHNVITQSMLHSSDIGSTDELVMVLTDHDYGDGNNELINSENSNIVVLYSHPIEGQENQYITSQGNLMLTSQANLIELRNGNAVVTTSAPHFIAANAVAQDANHIESIEMIQREINQHPHASAQVNLVPNIVKSNTVQPVTTACLTSTSNLQTFSQNLTESDNKRINSLETTQQHQLSFNPLLNVVTIPPVHIEQDNSSKIEEKSQTEELKSLSNEQSQENQLIQMQFETSQSQSTEIVQESIQPTTECIPLSQNTSDIQIVQNDENTSENEINLEENIQPHSENQDKSIIIIENVEENSENLLHDEQNSSINMQIEEKETTDVSDVNVEIPNVNIETPSVNTETPSVNTETASVNTETPSVSTETPSVSTETPSVTTETPSVTTETSSVNTETLSVNTETSSVNMTISSANMEIPSATLEIPSVTTEIPSSTVEVLSTPMEIPENEALNTSGSSTVNETDVSVSPNTIESGEINTDRKDTTASVSGTEQTSQEGIETRVLPNENTLEVLQGQLTASIELQESKPENDNTGKELQENLNENVCASGDLSVPNTNINSPQVDSYIIKDDTNEDNSQPCEDDLRQKETPPVQENDTDVNSASSQVKHVEEQSIGDPEQSKESVELVGDASDLHKSSEKESESASIANEMQSTDLEDDDSQSSQNLSNKPSYSLNTSNQSAKNILDDWEDTDSQQSDSKNGNSVHKLIDDWDDDEEEKKET